MSQPKIILVAGPTASGKTAFAVDLARKCHGTVINTDALQIYEGLPILTAQPTQEERQDIPHALYGVLPPDQHSSAGVWLEMAQQEVRDALAEHRTPILVGGTGLYFRAFTHGLADIPDVPQEVRDTTQNLYDELGEVAFRQRLADIDAESAAKLERNDRQRLIRAYEVAHHTGKPLSYWQKQPVDNPDNNYAYEPHILMPEREELYARCDKRFLGMLDRGAIEEVRAFMTRKLNPTLPVMKTIGLREIAAHLEGFITLDEAISQAQQATRNYAKRQMTWFRNQKLV